MSDNAIPSYGPKKTTVGMIAEFDTADQLLEAAAKCRDHGFDDWDTHSPFPLHGLSEAMGLKRSTLPYVVLGGGLAGCATGILLQWVTNTVWYPYLISGKPYFSVPANIPVTFEVTILFAGITAFLSILAFCNLPQPYHPVFLSNRFKRASDDKFFISVLAGDPKFDNEATYSFLESLGATAVERLEEDAPAPKPAADH